MDIMSLFWVADKIRKTRVQVKQSCLSACMALEFLLSLLKTSLQKKIQRAPAVFRARGRLLWLYPELLEKRPSNSIYSMVCVVFLGNRMKRLVIGGDMDPLGTLRVLTSLFLTGGRILTRRHLGSRSPWAAVTSMSRTRLVL